MNVEIQWFDEPGGCLRAWESDEGTHGQAYQRSASVRRLGDDTIEVHGLVERSNDDKPTMTKALWKAILKECRRQGITRVKFVRFKNGKELIKWAGQKSKLRDKDKSNGPELSR